jgi:hypothetical protein
MRKNEFSVLNIIFKETNTNEIGSMIVAAAKIRMESPIWRPEIPVTAASIDKAPRAPDGAIANKFEGVVESVTPNQK